MPRPPSASDSPPPSEEAALAGAYSNPGPLCRRYLAGFAPAKIPHRFTDVLILGSGVAGLSAALAASRDGRVEVTVIAKGALDETATSWAQGGVAAVVFPERTGDSLDAHVADTLECAGGLADERAARIMAAEGVDRVRELIEAGAHFDRDESGLHRLALEGAHSFPRILHRGDTTGREIERALVEAVCERENVICLESTFAIDLLTGAEGECRGALVHDRWGERTAIWSRRTILATGGAGRLYRETTNPAVATGDGIAMAFRAGAELRDLEFIQFHPTTLYVAGADRHLITEAARGEGGRLLDESGEPFMARYHPLGDLAPRDVVSRAILAVMKETRSNKVWLDLTTLPAEKVRERFPHVVELCRSFGIDVFSQPIPVRPSAHYTIGGVRSDLEGRTSIARLFAAGEVASTGLHGANRLGSNSLLEGLVFGHRAGRLAAKEAAQDLSSRPGFELPSLGIASQETPLVRQEAGQARGGLDLDDLASSLKSLLWYHVGVERNGESLASALRQIRSWLEIPLRAQFDDPPSWSVQNMLQTAYLLALSALRRTESRGVHFRSDHPERDDREWQRHLTVSRGDFAREESGTRG